MASLKTAQFIPLELPGLVLIRPIIHEDGRGFFYESYSAVLFAEHGIKDVFVQDNHSRSAKGVLRGLHYQLAPRAQTKLVRVARGSVLDVVVDLRKNSKTFGKHLAVPLNAETKEMLYVPVGFAHGYCTLEEGTELLYKVTDFYSPEHERGLLWNDPALGIAWPAVDFTISEKDKKNSLLKQAETF